MSLESHLTGATFGESMPGMVSTTSRYDLTKATLGARGGVRPPRPPPPVQSIKKYKKYKHAVQKSRSERKYKRNACSGNCKSGILMSGWVLRRGGGPNTTPA